MKKITLIIASLFAMIAYAQPAVFTATAPDELARLNSFPAGPNATVTEYTLDVVGLPLAPGANEPIFSRWKTAAAGGGDNVGGSRTITPALSADGLTLTVGGGVTINSSSIDSVNGRVSFNVSFNNLNAFGSTPNYGDIVFFRAVSFGGGDASAASNDVQSVVEPQPASLDEFNFDFGGTITQGASIVVPLTYISDLPVQVGALSIRLTAAKGPFEAGAELTVGTWTNDAVLPAAATATATTITMTAFPANFQNPNGLLLASRNDVDDTLSVPSELSEANPWNLANITSTFYFLDPIATTVDPDWLPANLPGRKFFGVTFDQVASVSDFSSKENLSISNPVSSNVDLGGSGEYSIYTLTGSLAQSGSYEDSINVEGLNSGFYILVTEDGFGKIIKN